MSARNNVGNAIGGNGNAGSPSPTLQVESQLDSACYALDTLESIVSAMLSRLEPVMADIPIDSALGECIGTCFVPLAGRINNIERRIRNASCDLERALHAMQI